MICLYIVKTSEATIFQHSAITGVVHILDMYLETEQVQIYNNFFF